MWHNIVLLYLVPSNSSGGAMPIVGGDDHEQGHGVWGCFHGTYKRGGPESRGVDGARNQATL